MPTIRRLLFTACVFMFACLLCSSGAIAQCLPQAADWMDKIKAIEGNEDPVGEKIRALNALEVSYTRCTALRDSILARMLHRLGDLYRVAGDVEKGIRYAREAIAINGSGRPGAQKSFLTHSYYNLAICYVVLYLFTESNKYFDSCIAVGSPFPEKSYILLMAYEQKAFSFYQMADYASSIEMADKGMRLSGQMRDTLFDIILLTQKAQSQLALGQTEEAERNVKVTIQALSRKDMPAERLATSYSIYARLLNTRKESREAAGYYKKAFELNLQQKNLSQCTRDLMDLGYLYDKDLHELEKAIGIYQQGITLANRVGDPYMVAGLYNNLGVACWRRQRFRLALTYYQKGLMALPIHFTDSAIAHNPSAGLLASTGDDYFVYTLFANKGESLLELSKKKKDRSLLLTALETYRIADKMVDQMRWRQYNDQSKLFWRVKTREMYANAIETCYRLGSSEDAFFFFEKSRAALLNDKLNELGAKKYLPKADLDREEGLRVTLQSLQQRVSSFSENSKDYDEVSREISATRETLGNFIHDLELKHPAYYSYKYDTTVHSTGEVLRGLLKDQRSLVEYFTTDSVVYALALTPDSVQMRRVRFAGYASAARELLALTSDRGMLNQHYPRWRQLAYLLYDTLFSIFSIPTRSVILSPDDQFIPFDLLLTDPATDTSFLLKRHAFSYAYSVNFLMKEKYDQGPLSSDLLGIAPVAYRPYLRLPSLNGADRSLENIGAYFSSSRLLVKEHATKQEFLSELPQYAVVHLYSHAYADSTEQEPVLYLCDSVLHLTELQSLGRLRTRLVVLSACNTGTGKHRQGEGVFSLARGFAAAGIPATVTNLWQIDEEATYRIMELFYKHLNAGVGGDEALQQAKLDFIRDNDKEHVLPYFWAASIYIGKTPAMKKGVVVRRSGGMNGYVVGVMLALVLAGVGVVVWLVRRGRG